MLLLYGREAHCTIGCVCVQVYFENPQSNTSVNIFLRIFLPKIWHYVSRPILLRFSCACGNRVYKAVFSSPTKKRGYEANVVRVKKNCNSTSKFFTRK